MEPSSFRGLKGSQDRGVQGPDQAKAEDGAGPCSKQGCSGHLAQAGAYARVVVGNWSEFTACSICFLHFVSIWSIKEKNL